MHRLLFVIALTLTAPVAQAADAGLAIRGAVAKPQSLSLADLRGLPSSHVAVTQNSGHGPVKLDCTGVAVSALLEKARPQYGAAKNARLAHTLLFTADDGYQVALAVAETDAAPGHAAPILALSCDSKALAAPRLIVPVDAEAGRAENGVVSLEVR
jgi:hypothetical protein